MSHLRLQKFIAQPPERVFAIFSDLENAARNVRGIESLTLLSDGPVGVGTRFRETRVLFGKQATEEMEVTEFVFPLRYTVEADSCGSHFKTTFRFSPGDGGTDVFVDIEVEPRSLAARLMRPLSALMLRPMRKCMEQDLDDLREVAETP